MSTSRAGTIALNPHRVCEGPLAPKLGAANSRGQTAEEEKSSPELSYDRDKEESRRHRGAGVCQGAGLTGVGMRQPEAAPALDSPAHPQQHLCCPIVCFCYLRLRQAFWAPGPGSRSAPSPKSFLPSVVATSAGAGTLQRARFRAVSQQVKQKQHQLHVVRPLGTHRGCSLPEAQGGVRDPSQA